MMKKIEKKMNLFTNSYNDYYVLTEWCQKYRPSLLLKLSFIGITKKDFEFFKERAYKTAVIKHIDLYKNLIDKTNRNENIDKKLIQIWYDDNNSLDNKSQWINDCQIKIAEFSNKDTKYLKWHCPLDFIRKFLKDNKILRYQSFYKIFFKR